MRPLADRFWEKVAPAAAFDCWEWTASKNQSGYGQIYLEGRPVKAHRVAYEMLRAEIPAGLQIDHLCRNRACVNPWHMEPVTNEVNTARGELRNSPSQLKTHCPQGHPYSPDNTRIHRRGYRTCITCDRARCLANYYKRKTAAA